MIIVAIILLAGAIVVPGLYLLLTTYLAAYPITRFHADGLEYSLELWKEPRSRQHALELEIKTVMDDREGVEPFPKALSAESRQVLLDQFIDRMTEYMSKGLPSREAGTQSGRERDR